MKRSGWASPTPPMFDLVGPIEIELPYERPPITANEARSVAHYHRQNTVKREIATAVVALLRTHRVPHLDRLSVTLTWYVVGRQRVDCDSLGPMMKACLDALTPHRAAIPKGSVGVTTGRPRKTGVREKPGAGVIDDDHAGIVASATTAVVLDASRARVLLRLEPLAPLPPRPAGSGDRPEPARP